MPLKITIGLAAFATMEFVAWFTHKYVLHGWLWWLHKSHHVRHDHTLERNDFFFLYYAAIAMVFFILGSETMDWRFWVAIGVTLYGAAYFVVHDLFIHQRVRIFGKTGNSYLKALDMAHKMHHKTQERDGSECFGMLLVPMKYYRLALRNRTESNKNTSLSN